jgi:gamma-glutamyltranspeptidase/glutathione hydrolase
LSDNFSDSQVVRKRVLATRGGVVAAQHKRAAEVGAAILEAGGDAVDAAVATSFALGVVEPWMSGVAAGGCMLVWRAGEGRPTVIDYGMRSPAALDPADYPIVGGHAADLFAWPRVKDDRNVQGATAVAVPGVVAGMSAAHERFGRMPWRELIAPAVRLAEEGALLDWFAGLQIASAAKALAADADAAALFLEERRWVPLAGWTALTEKRLDQRRLARTLDAIAREGAKALYGGDVGEAIARDVQAKGGSLSLDDLASYKAAVHEPLVTAYHGGRVFAAPGMTGGPALMACLESLSGKNKLRYVDYARALDAAWRRRLGESGDKESCTTHFSLVDRHGNLCAVTQTLLSIFGSRVVSPSTGVLLNNGVMWFDPQPGRPNSLAPGKRCLGNYCPAVGETPDGARFALGASGGRKIVGTVLQLASFLIDHGATLEEAFHRPRIDMSGGERVIADQGLPAQELQALQAAFPTTTARRLPFPYHFAVPAGVLRSGELNMGCTEIHSPWGDAVAERAS